MSSALSSGQPRRMRVSRVPLSIPFMAAQSVTQWVSPLNVKNLFLEVFLTGAIAFVSFEPLDTVFGARSRAHIGNKLLKRTFPSVANGDTSAAVVLELGVSWIPASLTDGEPNPILRHLGHAVRYTTYGSAGLPATEKAAKFVFSGWSTKALLTTFKAMVLYFRHLRTSFLGATGWSRFLDSAPLTHYNLEQLKGFNYA